MKYKKLLLSLGILSLLAGCSDIDTNSNTEDITKKVVSNYDFSDKIKYNNKTYNNVADFKKDLGYLYQYAQYKEDVVVEDVDITIGLNEEALAILNMSDKYDKELKTYAKKLGVKDFDNLINVDKQRIKEAYVKSHYQTVMSDLLTQIVPITYEDITKYSEKLDKSKTIVLIKNLDSQTDKEAEEDFANLKVEYQNLGISKDLTYVDKHKLLKNNYALATYTDILSYGINTLNMFGISSHEYKSSTETDKDINSGTIYSEDFKNKIKNSEKDKWYLVKSDKEHRKLYKKHGDSSSYVGDFAYKVVSEDNISESELKLYVQREKFKELFYNKDGLINQKTYIDGLLKCYDNISKDFNLTKELYTEIDKAFEKSYNQVSEDNKETTDTKIIGYTDLMNEQTAITLVDYAMSSIYTPYFEEGFTDYLITENKKK